MPEPDRDEYARRNALWIGGGFGAVLVIGLVRGNIMAVIAGVLGLGWLGRAFRRGRR